MEHNKKIKVIVHMLRIHSRVKPVGGKPVVLQWIDDESMPQFLPSVSESLSGLSGLSDLQKNENKNDKNAGSDRSDSNIDNSKTIEIETEPEPEPNIQFEKPEVCPNCDRMISPFDKNIHAACCQGKASTN